MESCSNQKQIYFQFEILQSSHPLPWRQLFTRLAFSQPLLICLGLGLLIKFLKHTSIRHNFKYIIPVNPATLSNFKKCFTAKAPQRLLGHHQLKEKPSHFSSQREEPQKAQIEIHLITNLWWSLSDDTHRTSCYTIHVCFVR